MPIRSGAMQRPSGCRCGNTLRQRYDEVGLPCSSTMGAPSPTSTYAISRPRTRRRCFWYGNAAEIMFASPVAAAGATSLLFIVWDIFFIVWDIAMKHSFQVGWPRSIKERRAEALTGLQRGDAVARGQRHARNVLFEQVDRRRQQHHVLHQERNVAGHGGKTRHRIPSVRHERNDRDSHDESGGRDKRARDVETPCPK